MLAGGGCFWGKAGRCPFRLRLGSPGHQARQTGGWCAYASGNFQGRGRNWGMCEWIVGFLDMPRAVGSQYFM